MLICIYTKKSIGFDIKKLCKGRDHLFDTSRETIVLTICKPPAAPSDKQPRPPLSHSIGSPAACCHRNSRNPRSTMKSNNTERDDIELNTRSWFHLVTWVTWVTWGSPGVHTRGATGSLFASLGATTPGSHLAHTLLGAHWKQSLAK